MTTSHPYRILGIDPGTATVGWGIIDVFPASRRPHVVAYGHISTHATASDEDRLSEIADDVTQIITIHKPHVAAIEDLFFFKNQKTIITVAQARGVLLYVCNHNNLPLSSYTPLQVKQALTGYGRANKQQMQEMTMKTLSLKSLPQPDDTADALAVALCHHSSYRFREKIHTLQ